MLRCVRASTGHTACNRTVWVPLHHAKPSEPGGTHLTVHVHDVDGARVHALAVFRVRSLKVISLGVLPAQVLLDGKVVGSLERSNPKKLPLPNVFGNGNVRTSCYTCSPALSLHSTDYITPKQAYHACQGLRSMHESLHRKSQAIP